jgi:hypothetical protein
MCVVNFTASFFPYVCSNICVVNLSASNFLSNYQVPVRGGEAGGVNEARRAAPGRPRLAAPGVSTAHPVHLILIT